jgi:hypothetical protein
LAALRTMKSQLRDLAIKSRQNEQEIKADHPQFYFQILSVSIS